MIQAMSPSKRQMVYLEFWSSFCMEMFGATEESLQSFPLNWQMGKLSKSLRLHLEAIQQKFVNILSHQFYRYGIDCTKISNDPTSIAQNLECVSKQMLHHTPHNFCTPSSFLESEKFLIQLRIRRLQFEYLVKTKCLEALLMDNPWFSYTPP